MANGQQLFYTQCYIYIYIHIHENDITFDEETQPLVIKNKGIFHPHRNRNKTLDIVIVVDYLNNQNFDNATTKNKSSISENEWEATKALK